MPLKSLLKSNKFIKQLLNSIDKKYKLWYNSIEFKITTGALHLKERKISDVRKYNYSGY